ncbi:hypothetical protein SBRCBS47491_007483 [Sporothrix bragantina]|uniref:Uncharacterized protein n=1 Tax=Sporothrix bragantina TaxID=671064 RepID=A0ABP0CDI6_9PEZI
MASPIFPTDPVVLMMDEAHHQHVADVKVSFPTPIFDNITPDKPIRIAIDFKAELMPQLIGLIVKLEYFYASDPHTRLAVKTITVKEHVDMDVCEGFKRFYVQVPSFLMRGEGQKIVRTKVTASCRRRTNFTCATCCTNVYVQPQLPDDETEIEV